jgi:dUTP pyrophosphatase
MNDIVKIIEFGVWLNKEEYPHAQVPKKAHYTDAGFDLFAVESLVLHPGDRKVIPTGVHLQMDDGWEAQIRPRSGNAAKHGITITNSPATIDSSYVGHVMVILQNTGNNDFIINIGDKIAQLVFKKVPFVSLLPLSEKPTNNSRGEKGFGSSGK